MRTWASLRGHYSAYHTAFAVWFDYTLAGPMAPLWTLLWCDTDPGTMMPLLCTSSWVHWGFQYSSPRCPSFIPACPCHVHSYRPSGSYMTKRPLRIPPSQHSWSPQPCPSKCGPGTSGTCIICKLIRNVNLRPHCRPTESGSLLWAQESGMLKFRKHRPRGFSIHPRPIGICWNRPPGEGGQASGQR